MGHENDPHRTSETFFLAIRASGGLRVKSAPFLPLWRTLRSIRYEYFPDGLYCWVRCASACILLPERYPCTCPASWSALGAVADSTDTRILRRVAVFVAVRVHGL
jgi:hypothetical protein